jgi:large subunit ribosomal protein L23
MSLLVIPRMSEKAYDSATNKNTYVFVVPLTANKIEIKKAVEADYDVQVETVNIVRQNGKVKRTIRKGGRAITGKRNDFKKAYVLLAEGQSIPVFAALEEEAK